VTDFIKLFIPTFFFFLLIDYIWIGIIASKYYSSEFGELARRTASGAINANIFAAFAAYFLLVFGMIYFVYPKIQSNSSLIEIIITGALFGFIIYGVYDMTNLAILKGFGVKLAIVDMIWGGIVCMIVSLFLYIFSKILT